MKQQIECKHLNDADGNPGGGATTGTGIVIIWQNGPLGRGDDRKEPNGAFVEGVIAAALDRLEYYQASKFRCAENAQAIEHLKVALAACESRTAKREQRAVEGTHTA